MYWFRDILIEPAEMFGEDLLALRNSQVNLSTSELTNCMNKFYL